MSHKSRNEAPEIEPLGWDRAVEIATAGNAPVDLDEFNRLGKAAQGITTLKTDNGREVHKRPDGRFISADLAEAVKSEADPESQKLSYDSREILKEKLADIERGELPSSVKRDFNLNKDEQLKQLRVSIENELSLSNQLIGLDHQKDKERHETAARNIARLKNKRELRERELLNKELKRTEDEAYEAEMAKLEPELQKRISELEGTSEQRYHKGEQLKLEARKEARQRVKEAVQERKQVVKEAGGPGAINKLNEKEEDARKKAEFRARHGVGEKRNERPKRDPQSINDGRAPVKPDHVSSQDWWAMTGEQRRNKLRDPKHIWFDHHWANRYDDLTAAGLNPEDAFNGLKHKWFVELGLIKEGDIIDLDGVNPTLVGAAIFKKAGDLFGGDMDQFKKWARKGDWMTPSPDSNPQPPAPAPQPILPNPLSNPSGSKGASVLDLAKNHAGGLSFVGASVLAQIFAEASAPKTAAFTLLTGAFLRGSKEIWNKTNSLVRGIGGMAVTYSGAQALTGDYFDGKNLIAAAAGAGFGLGYKQGKKVMKSILKRIEGNGDADSKKSRKKWAKIGGVALLTATIVSSGAYMAIQGGSSKGETGPTTTAVEAGVDSAPTSTGAVNSEERTSGQEQTGETLEDALAKQRAGVKARADELGVKLSDSKINKIVDDAFNNAMRGDPTDFVKMTAHPEIAKALTDHAILVAAGISS